MEENVVCNSKFFKDQPSEYIFYLIETDGLTRTNLLNITEELYYDKSKAIEWHNNIYNAIIRHEDKELISAAIKQLEKLYNVMAK